MRQYCLWIAVCFQLSANAQPGTEIIVFDVSINKAGITVSSPANITNHKGYDNQPYFYKSNIYYSSHTDSAQMDIMKYDLHEKTTNRITKTADNEFSPTLTPDKKYISCILQRKNGKQDLVKYPLAAGTPRIIIDNLKVGYHAWADNNNLVLFVLEDTSTFTLNHYNTATRKNKIITADIGRSLQKIPGKPAVSFIKKYRETWVINQYDVLTKKTTKIVTTPVNWEFHTWTKNGLIIITDGSEIYFTAAGNKWKKVNIKSDIPLKNITRLALNEQNNKLAVVISE